MHAIRIDRARSLCEEPHLGHNRYHPDIEPILEVAPGRAFQVAQGTRATAQIPVSGVQPRTGLRHRSVAMDRRISNVVDLPKVVVSALLPEAIFD